MSRETPSIIIMKHALNINLLLYFTQTLTHSLSHTHTHTQYIIRLAMILSKVGYTFSRIRVLQASFLSFLLGRWSRVLETGTPVAGTCCLLLLINCWRSCCLGPPIYSSSLSYSAGWFAALTKRASKKTRA